MTRAAVSLRALWPRRRIDDGRRPVREILPVIVVGIGDARHPAVAQALGEAGLPTPVTLMIALPISLFPAAARGQGHARQRRVDVLADRPAATGRRQHGADGVHHAVVGGGESAERRPREVGEPPVGHRRGQGRVGNRQLPIDAEDELVRPRRRQVRGNPIDALGRRRIRGIEPVGKDDPVVEKKLVALRHAVAVEIDRVVVDGRIVDGSREDAGSARRQLRGELPVARADEGVRLLAEGVAHADARCQDVEDVRVAQRR